MRDRWIGMTIYLHKNHVCGAQKCRQNKVAIACIACCLTILLSGCVIVATEVVPRAINGKGLAEDAADLGTGKDCRVVEGTVRKNRKICETRGSPETKKDFKGLSGIEDNKTPNTSAK
jgi:hypothetical protein